MGPAIAAPEVAAAAAPAAKGATDILAPAAAAGAGEAAAAGAPLAILPEAATAGLGAAAPVAGEGAAMATGLVLEPAFAPAVIGASIPGLDTTAAGIGLGLEGAGGLGAPLGGAIGGTTGGAGGAPLSLDNLAATGNTAGTLPGGGAPIGTTAAPGGTGIAPGTATGATTAAAPPGVTSPVALDPTAAAAPGATAGAAPAAGGSPSIASMLSPGNLAQGVVKSITSNPLGTALAFGGLGFSALNKPATPNTDALKAQAAQLNEQGQQLAAYLQSGNLPPGLKAALDKATSSAKANIISNFAARGLSTDPSKNSALADELQAVDTQAVISTAQIGQGLLTTGINETNMSSQLYTTLANIDQANTQRISQSIANFAAAMSPTRGFTINTGSK